MSDIGIFVKRIEALIDDGQVMEANKAISRHMAKQKFPVYIFGTWMEIAAATQCTPLSNIKAAMKRAPLTGAEKAILDSYVFTDAWVRFDIQILKALMSLHHDFTLAEDGDTSVIACRIYFKFCIRLLNYRLQNLHEYSGNFEEKLFFIGESHSLVPSGRIFPWRGQMVQAIAKPIRGIKMFHLGKQAPRKWKSYFSEILNSLTNGCHVVLAIGEIDCRPDDGIFHAACQRGISAADLLEKTVSEFIFFVSDEFRKLDKNISSICLMGAPFPAYDLDGRLPAATTKQEFFDFVASANIAMRLGAMKAGWDFLDVYSATLDGAKEPDNLLRIDATHLSPAFYSQAEQWRVSPQSGT